MINKNLKEKLELHKRWVESDGTSGERLDLSGANLECANLRGASLPFFISSQTMF